jgi:hypothetical protein
MQKNSDNVIDGKPDGHAGGNILRFSDFLKIDSHGNGKIKENVIQNIKVGSFLISFSFYGKIFTFIFFRFSAINPVFLFNFNVLWFHCPGKTIRVQNFEPPLVIKI